MLSAKSWHASRIRVSVGFMLATAAVATSAADPPIIATAITAGDAADKAIAPATPAEIPAMSPTMLVIVASVSLPPLALLMFRIREPMPKPVLPYGTAFADLPTTSITEFATFAALIPKSIGDGPVGSVGLEAIACT